MLSAPMETIRLPAQRDHVQEPRQQRKKPGESIAVFLRCYLASNQDGVLADGIEVKRQPIAEIEEPAVMLFYLLTYSTFAKGAVVSK
jgi:hypothetical protein